MNGIKIQNGLDRNRLSRGFSTGMLGSCFCLEFNFQITEVASPYGLMDQFGITIEPILEDAVRY